MTKKKLKEYIFLLNISFSALLILCCLAMMFSYLLVIVLLVLICTLAVIQIRLISKYWWCPTCGKSLPDHRQISAQFNIKHCPHCGAKIPRYLPPAY